MNALVSCNIYRGDGNSVYMVDNEEVDMTTELTDISSDASFTLKAYGKLKDWDGWDKYNQDMQF